MNPNVRSAEGYYIAVTRTGCWKCQQEIDVAGVFLPPGHETLEPDLEGAEWEEQENETAVYFLVEVAPAPLNELHKRAPALRRSQAGGGEYYWANHCTHCGAVQGDFYLYQQPEGAFHPVEVSAAANVTLFWFAGPFAADCEGISLGGVMLFEAMARA